MAKNLKDVSGLTYEQARDELIAIVAKLEAGTATLDESLGLWERGEALAARCQALLDGARDRIEDSRGTDPGSADPNDTDPIDADPNDAGVVAIATNLGDDEEEEDNS